MGSSIHVFCGRTGFPLVEAAGLIFHSITSVCEYSDFFWGGVGGGRYVTSLAELG